MTVVLQLRPELEQRALAQAAAQGVPVEAYLTAMLEAQLLPAASPPGTLKEIEADLDAFADDSDDLPVLPPEALTREAIYADHD